MGAAYPQYIYHNDKTQQYFGRFDSKENDIVYDNKYLKQGKSHADGSANSTATGPSSISSSQTAASNSGQQSSASTPAADPTVGTKESTPYKIHFDIV